MKLGKKELLKVIKYLDADVNGQVSRKEIYAKFIKHRMELIRQF